MNEVLNPTTTTMMARPGMAAIRGGFPGCTPLAGSRTSESPRGGDAVEGLWGGRSCPLIAGAMVWWGHDRSRMVGRGMGVLLGFVLAAVMAIPSLGLAAQLDLELLPPARDAERAIQAARRAGAAETAAQDLSLADLYVEDARAALHPASGPPNFEKATRLFRLAEAQAKLAEARTTEEARTKEAAGAASQFLQSIDPVRPGAAAAAPSVSEAADSLNRLREDAARARSARRAAEETVERLWREGE